MARFKNKARLLVPASLLLVGLLLGTPSLTSASTAYETLAQNIEVLPTSTDNENRDSAVPDALVTTLGEIYDDKTRAQEDLEAMYEAGIIDGNGKLTGLDLCEDGKSVGLSELTKRIANGEKVGDITVNGKPATSEQVMKISQVNAALEIAELLKSDIDVTDDHAKNLEALVRGIQSGAVDLKAALKTGSIVSSTDEEATSGDESEEPIDYSIPGNVKTVLEFPEQTWGRTGCYAPYIDDGVYEPKHLFGVPNGTASQYPKVIPETSGTIQGTATVEGNLRRDMFDWPKAIIGVNDDDRGYPLVTAILPLKTDDAIQDLIASDMDAGGIADISENGIGLEMELPIYGKVNLKYYFRYMYFSYSQEGYFDSNGAMRFPCYLIQKEVNGEERVVAIATRYTALPNRYNNGNSAYADPAVNSGFAPEESFGNELFRMDSLCLYVDPEGRTEWNSDDPDGSKGYPKYPFLPSWEESYVDRWGYHYWDMAWLKTLRTYKDYVGTLRQLSYYLTPDEKTGFPHYIYDNNMFQNCAPVIPGRALRYFVAPVHRIDNTYWGKDDDEWMEAQRRARKHIVRPEGSYEEVANGFLKLKDPENPDFPYVYPTRLPFDGHEDWQQDVELMVTEDLYNAYAKAEKTTLSTGEEALVAPIHMWESDYRVAIRLSDRADFSIAPEYAFDADGRLYDANQNVRGKAITKVDWHQPSNGTYEVLSEFTDDTWIATINPLKVTAADSEITSEEYFKAQIFPSFVDQEYLPHLSIPILFRVLEPSYEPYLKVPASSRIRQSTVGLDTDIMFSSNIAQYNKLEAGTTFQAELYQVGGIDKDNPDTLPSNARKVEVANWGKFPASKEDLKTHITVPGSSLSQAGTYAVKISADYSDGTATQTFSVIIYINVKQSPARVELGKVESDSIDTDHIPNITYRLENAAPEVEVKYTIQGSGEALGEMKDAVNGTIPFAPEPFEGLRKAYTITVYARNKESDPWSVDSMVLTIYNNDILKLLIKDVALGQIGGETGGKVSDDVQVASGTINIDNNPKIAELLAETGEGAGYQITDYDFDALRRDVGLQRVISVNYGDGVWGAISDRIRWTYTEADGKTSDAVTLNREENGTYADLREYSYTAYIPSTDFLIVATDDRSADAPVTITATHAATGTTQSVDVTVNTLRNKLYLFRFSPKVKTYVTYTNGKGELRELHTNDLGELIVYEPDGIASEIFAMCDYEDKTYAGTLANEKLASGERNITKLQVYPCNNLTLAPMTDQTLTIFTPDGKPYSGSATLRVGVYKGNVYDGDVGVRTTKEESVQLLRQDVNVTVENGKVSLYYDATQLKANNGLRKGITYVYEYRVPGYQPGYIVVKASAGASASTINLQNVRGQATSPQITRQEYQQYQNGNRPTSYIRNVIDSTGYIGISPNFTKAILYTDIALPGANVTTDDQGYSTYSGENVVKFSFVTTSGKKLTGQTDLESVDATQILNLDQLKKATYFVFPFSSVPMLRSTYTMTNDNMKADGIDDTAKTPSTRIKAVFTVGERTIASMNMPFGLTNVSNQPNLLDNKEGATAVGKEIRDELRETTDIGAIFRSINVNDMIKKGFIFLGNLTGVGGDNPIDLMILPTQDPATFRIIAMIGESSRGGSDDDGDGVSAEFNPNDLAEDINGLLEEIEDSGKDKKDDKAKGNGSIELNFYGTVVLEARAGVTDGKWDINFLGGNAGTNVKGKYEWSQTFMCGPYPIFISLEAGFYADLEVSFGSKDSARAMLLDVALGVSLEAFAGLGFDLSIVSFQLGIYGQIGADVNFLLLSQSNGGTSTGTKLSIAGEIGIKIKIKLLFISYSKKFASTGFNWTKKWNKYDQILNSWEDQGYGQLFGVTRKGRAYTMLLMPDGSAIVAIDGKAELESRDYLELQERAWNNGLSNGKKRLRSTESMNSVQENAYPYSHPAFTDDGEMFVYISDNDNARKVESVASYAVSNGSGYDNKGRIDTSADNVLADLDVVASGTKDNAFAAWVKQVETVDPIWETPTSNDDLGMMFNATEIYASTYNGTSWTTSRLTDNTVADMSPSIASYGNKAIVAWRSMNASSMDAASGSDITSVFDQENNINYRIYNGSEWTEAKVAYNGSSGTVNAIDSAMLSDGTAMLTYTVRSGEDVTSTETFYTVIKADGTVLTTGRLTNDDYTDTNAQVTAVNEGDGYFVLGWYSEHDAGEGDSADYDEEGNATAKAAVAHDIRLARINANGSYDVDFLESIGGTASSSITSDFRFSAPANNTDLTKVSIVWSQRKVSDELADAGKYQLCGVRFTRNASSTGVTSPTLLSETSKNYTIDDFDAYTDANGTVHAIVLGSDYNSIKGIEVYDTIDLNAAAGSVITEENSSEPDNLDILDGEAISSLKLATGTFPQYSADITVETSIKEVMPGFSTPVQFTITNTGTDTLTKVTVKIGEESKDHTLNLLPGRSTTLLTSYNVPEGAVSDVIYSLDCEGNELASGTLLLNRPDIGISEVKIIKEYEGKRDIRVTLNNAYGIPLTGSGKTVQVSFYKDPMYQTIIGEAQTISESAYPEIDNGTYHYVTTLNVSDLITLEEGKEVPEGGAVLYVRAKVVDVEEPSTRNNDANVRVEGLYARNNGVKYTIDTTLEENNGEYIVTGYITNNSILAAKSGIPVALLYDEEGKLVAEKEMSASFDMAAESQKTVSVSFVSTDIEEGVTPVSASVAFIYEIGFDVNGGKGEFASVRTDLEGRIILPESEPVPPSAKPALFFRGWYLEKEGGEAVNEDTVFEDNLTLYARYTKHEHVFEFSKDGDETIVAKCVSTVNDDCTLEEHDRIASLTIVAPQRAETGYGSPDASIVGPVEEIGDVKISYFTLKGNGLRGEALQSAPAEPGKYWAEFTLGEGSNSVTAFVMYEIPAIGGDFPKASLPEFVKLEDLSTLTSAPSCHSSLAYGWIYNNMSLLEEGDGSGQSVPSYIVYGFDANFGEVRYFIYESSRMPMADSTSLDDFVEEAKMDGANVYIMGSRSTTSVVYASFKQVQNNQDMSPFCAASLPDAMNWVALHLQEYPAGIILVNQTPWGDYTFLTYNYQTTNITSGDPFQISEMQGDVPIFMAEPSDFVNPMKTYSIQYVNVDGGEQSIRMSYYAKSVVELYDGGIFSKENAVLVGWNTSSRFDGEFFPVGKTIEMNRNLTLYAVWEHVHHWDVRFDQYQNAWIAECNIDYCPERSVTLQPTPVDKVYDGENALPYQLGGSWSEENGLPMPTVTYYVNGVEVPEAKNVGTYTAKVALNGQEVEVGEFHITKRPVTVSADGAQKHEGQDDPVLTATSDGYGLDVRFENDATYPWTIVTGDGRTYAKSGNQGQTNTTSTLTLKVTLSEAGVVSFDYLPSNSTWRNPSRFVVNGEEKFAIQNADDSWKHYSLELAAGEYTFQWSYTIDYEWGVLRGYFLLDNFTIETSGALSQTEADKTDADIAFARDLTTVGGLVGEDTLNYTASREAGETQGTYAITLTMGDNPNYEVKSVKNGTFTIVEPLGETQVIEANDITANYGSGSVNIGAKVTTGDGTLSYKVTSGNAVTVDENGNLTITKVGQAVIEITAAKTATYAETVKTINVTVKGKPVVVSASDVTAVEDGKPHGVTISVSEPATGYVVKYGLKEGKYVFFTSPTLEEAGTLTIYYRVTADNYEPVTGSVTLTLTSHNHNYTYSVGTGDKANTITAVCSAEDCPLPANTATLIINAPSGILVYNGQAYVATLTDENGIAGNAKILYALKGANGTFGKASETLPVNAGIYRASITVGTVTAYVEFEIKPAKINNASVEPVAILVYDGTAQTPTVNVNANAVNGQPVTFTYSRNENGVYGEMPAITNVSEAGTIYFKASAPNHEDVYGSFVIRMDKSAQSAPAAPTLDRASGNTIRLVAVEGYEYSMDGSTWQDSPTFRGLTKNTEYTFYQRAKETENQFASPSSVSAKFSTTNHSHEWGNFVVNGATITATCLDSDGGHGSDKTATIVITAPTLTVYGGSGNAFATVNNDIDEILTPSIVYKQGDKVLSSAPTNAGTYTASITLKGSEIGVDHDVTATLTYTIAKKALTVTANAASIVYGEAPKGNGVVYDGFLPGEDESVLTGEVGYAFNYVQYGNVGTYAITPQGLTSSNYEITFVKGALTVTPKEITVNIDKKTAHYGDDQVTLTGTSDGIVNNDQNVYTLACDVTKTTGVGAYNIVGTDTSENYVVTFVGGENAYEVTKRPITLTAEEKTIKVGEALPTYSFKASEALPAEVLATLKEKTSLSCQGNANVVGKYKIAFAFNSDVTGENVLANYVVTLQEGYLYVLSSVLTDPSSGNSGVEILLDNATDAFDYNVSVTISVETPTEGSTPTSFDFSKISGQYIDSRSEISKVYSITLYRTEIVDGVEIKREIQPSDMKQGLNLIIKIEIPQNLVGQNFRILHIHSETDVEYVDAANLEIKEGFAYVKVNRLSQFAFVTPKANSGVDHTGWCIGWLVVIFDALLAAYLTVYVILWRKKKLGVIGLDVIGLGVSGALTVFALIVLILHTCYASIIGFGLAVAMLIGFIIVFILRKKSGKGGTPTAVQAVEPVAEVAQEEAAEAENEIPLAPSETASPDDETI